jgi:UPF0716 protein FxsA
MARLGTLFVLIPILELVLLIRVGEWIGFLATVFLVVATGVLGAFLIRREGLRAILSVQLELARGQLPTRVLLDGAAILVAGALLMTPGILTDLAGFFLLLPPTRLLVERWARARLTDALARGSVRVATWGSSGRWGATSPEMDERGAKGSHRSKAGSPVSFGETGVPRDDSSGSRPPRPGEIIQE